MKKNTVLFCLLSGLVLTACDEGSYNDLKCDESYVAECLDLTHYMVCEDNVLTVRECANTQLCSASVSVGDDGKATAGPASCIDVAGMSLKCDCATGANCTQAQKAACPECTTGQKKCETAENVSTAYTCGSDGKWAPSTCKNGCSGDVCAEAPEDVCETTCADANTMHKVCTESGESDVTCAVGCDAVSNECTAMTVSNVGEKCDAGSYQEHCVGDIVAYCLNDAVNVAYCLNPNTSCRVSQKLGGIANCVEKCNAPSDVKNECVYHEGYGCYMPSKTVCESIDGDNYGFSLAMDCCYSGCNDDNTGCRLENEGEACRLTDPHKCAEDGTYIISCYEGDDMNFVTADLCGEGTACMVNGEGKAGCYVPCAEADAGKEVVRCDEFSIFGYSFSISVTDVCTKIADGAYGYVTSKETGCAHTCAEGKCVVYDETEGQECEPSYAECKGGLAMNCYVKEGEEKGKIEAERCADYGESFKCALADGKAACIEECPKTGAQRLTCASSYEGDEVVRQVCAESAEFGFPVWEDDETLYDCGYNYCNDEGTACEKASEDEYEECTAESYPDRCSSGIATYCDTDAGIVRALDCASDGMICVSAHGYADCYDPCLNDGKKRSTCSKLFSEAVHYTCTRLDDGRLIEIPDRTEECKNGCNEDGTACK